VTAKSKRQLTVGWREWALLRGLNCPEPVKVKIDTGAATSALHAAHIHRFVQDDQDWVRFTIRPHQRTSDGSVRVEALLIDERRVRSSDGNSELRPVIETEITIGNHTWPIEVTLTRRPTMGYRMLLGRQALRNRAIVDVSRSFTTGKPARLGKSRS